MERTKISGLIFILILTAFGFLNAQAQNWKITSSQSGGIAGIRKSYTLDNRGNLNRINKDERNYVLIDAEKVAAIGKLVKALKLSQTKLKTVKGKRIYDGIYSGFVINLNGKDYNIEGTSFGDAKYLALSKKQLETLGKLREKLDELNKPLPAFTNNR